MKNANYNFFHPEINWARTPKAIQFFVLYHRQIINFRKDQSTRKKLPFKTNKTNSNDACYILFHWCASLQP